jgi:hypothetical protein
MSREIWQSVSRGHNIHDFVDAAGERIARLVLGTEVFPWEVRGLGPSNRWTDGWTVALNDAGKPVGVVSGSVEALGMLAVCIAEAIPRSGTPPMLVV